MSNGWIKHLSSGVYQSLIPGSMPNKPSRRGGQYGHGKINPRKHRRKESKSL